MKQLEELGRTQSSGEITGCEVIGEEQLPVSEPEIMDQEMTLTPKESQTS